MAVRKRGDRWFVDFRYRDAAGRARRIRQDSPVNTKRGAEEFERQIRNEQLSPTAPEQEVLFLDFAKEFQEIYVMANVKYATQVSYESLIRFHLLPEFEKLLLSEISTRRIEKFKARMLASGRSAKTVRNMLALLLKMLRVARGWGHLRELPHVQLPKVPKPRFRFLSEEECDGLLRHCGEYWFPPVYFALMTGCRQGELFAMEREQVDLEAGVVRVDRAVWRGVVSLPKHDKVRNVDLSPNLVEWLRGYLRVVPLNSKLLFPKPDGGIRLERRADQGLRRAAKRAGIDPFGWHVLRHSFASRLVRAGVHLQAVQQLLGHSRIDETMRYAHLSPNMKRDAVEKLDLLGNQSENFGQYMGNGLAALRQTIGNK